MAISSSFVTSLTLLLHQDAGETGHRSEKSEEREREREMEVKKERNKKNQLQLYVRKHLMQ